MSAKVFGARLRQLRKKGGHTQESLAHELEVSWATVSRWERGSLPPLERVYQIAEVLGVEPSSLLEDVKAVA
jgi:transcriptional regulator with XRE-family HTH domain